MKLLAALAIAGALAAPSPAQAPVPRDEPVIRYNAIALIECEEYSGTAFWVGRDRIITANHVSGDRACSIGGVPLTLVRNDVLQDVAEFTGLPSRVWLHVRCRGPRAGDVVHFVGYAGGRFRHTSRTVATSSRDDGAMEPIARGMLELTGQSYPGMSGGPGFDRNGEVVSMLNRGRGMPNPATWGRVLADSFLCLR